MTTTISSQRFADDAIIAAKIAANDFVVSVSPEFDFDGATFRVVIDGHHSLEAAKLAGVEPEWVELTVTECDAINMLRAGDIEGFLDATYNDSDYYDVATGRNIW